MLMDVDVGGVAAVDVDVAAAVDVVYVAVVFDLGRV